MFICSVTVPQEVAWVLRRMPTYSFPPPRLIATGMRNPITMSSCQQTGRKAIATLEGVTVLIIMRMSAVTRGRCLASGVW